MPVGPATPPESNLSESARVDPIPVQPPAPEASEGTVSHTAANVPIVDQPYVTIGFVTFPNGDPAPMTGPTTAVSTVLLQHRVASVCGDRARDIRVVPESADRLVIHLTVTDAETGQRLSRLILDMPELGPFRVSLQVHSGQ